MPNSVDQDQTLHTTASDQCLHCLLTEIVTRNKLRMKKYTTHSYVWIFKIIIINARYKRSEERKILDEAMKLLLPICYQRCTQLLTDVSEAANLLQKQILKIYYAFIQVRVWCLKIYYSFIQVRGVMSENILRLYTGKGVMSENILRFYTGKGCDVWKYTTPLYR